MKKSISSFLLKYLHRKLGVPRQKVYGLLRHISKTSESTKTNAITREKGAVGNVGGFKKDGYKYIDFKDDSVIKNLISDCASLYEKKRGELSDEYFVNNPKKRFLLTVESDERLLERKNIREFLSSDYVLDNVYSYLNTPFVLSALRLWWTPVNDSVISSQKYHLDEEDTSQVKLLINVTDVDSANGPFTFLSSQQSEKILNSYPVSKRRYTDSEVEGVLGNYTHQSIMGPAGYGGFVDTSKCLHFGSRNNTDDRVVFMAQFLKADSPFLTKSLSMS